MEDESLPNYEQLYRELIGSFKNQPVLWDKSHPKNKCRETREKALEEILQTCKTYYPDADYDYVKTKIDSIRNCFRKEHRKVIQSKESTGSDIYKPTLWYYNLMLFTVGEESSEYAIESSRFNIWSKANTIVLINLLKNYPILYRYDISRESHNLSRKSALRKLTDEINTVTGKKFQITHVRMKIRSLKCQYRKEVVLRQRRKGTNMWCYNLLGFLKNNPSSNKTKRKKMPSCSDESDGDYINDIKEENDAEPARIQSKLEDYEDVFDTIGKNVAHKLRDMTDEQRIYAERILNSVMYHGLMEDLNPQSSLVL